MHKWTDNQRAWVAALRSGEFDQERGFLSSSVDRLGTKLKHCCLGVGCVLAGVPRVVQPYAHEFAGAHKFPTTTTHPSYIVQYGEEGTDGLMPAEGARWLDLKSPSGSLPFEDRYDDHLSLAIANDAYCTFDQIADLIEHFADYLFVRRGFAA